ncbi:hypothetical protein HDR66_00895 [bacterium]|nr:hypothetical protein [bacterium]
MFKGEFRFDLKTALGLRGWGGTEYGTAYCLTNEPIEDWLTLTPTKNRRILSVAASGDQPLLYRASGATHVDTFDLTINACAIMDFKTTASQLLNYTEYLMAVLSLKSGCKIPQNIFNMVVDSMPERTRELMHNLGTYRKDAFMRDRYCNNSFPKTDEIYKQIHQTSTTPFNFIWADLGHLSGYLDGKYDIMYLSNIFEHYLGFGRAPMDIRITIQSLWPYLNVGGYIVCTSSGVVKKTIFDKFIDAWQNMGAKLSYPQYDHPTWQPIVIQKTR